MSLILLFMITAFGAGLFSLLFLRKVKKVQWIILFLVSGFSAYTAFRYYGMWNTAEAVSSGVRVLTLQNTPFGWIFFAVTGGVMFLISVFSLSYNDKRHATGIAPLWMMLLSANAGIFFAADWITFLIAWEIMGWTSFFIISHGREDSFKAGIYYYALSLLGAAAMFAAVFILANFTGTFGIRESIAGLRELWGVRPGIIYSVGILFLITFFSKSAVGPFYMWPAKAHAEAPDDFSSFLSGIMIKYGVYGMLVTLVPLFITGYAGPMINNTPVFLYIVAWIGALTALWGTLLAVRENDMKRLMAFSTVSNLGFIVFALSVNTYFGVAAAIFHTFNHMVFKSSIFLSMASVKFRTGEREMHRLGGIGYRMPVAFFAFLLGIIAAAGIPPMNGFASKWMVFQSLFDNNLLILSIPAFFASTAAFLYLYRGLHSIYLGQLSPRFANIKAAPPLQMLSMGIMMMMLFAVGVFPGLFLHPINDAVVASGGEAVQVSLSAIVGSTSKVNLTVVAATFMGAFMLVMALYLLGKRRKLVAPLDTYTAGESPEDWNMTPEQYHYAYNFYEPFEKLTGPILKAFSFEGLFEGIRENVSRFGRAVGRGMSLSKPGTILIAAVVVIILAAGIAIW